jgi:hypothetical protein
LLGNAEVEQQSPENAKHRNGRERRAERPIPARPKLLLQHIANQDGFGAPEQVWNDELAGRGQEDQQQPRPEPPANLRVYPVAKNRPLSGPEVLGCFNEAPVDFLFSTDA